MDPLSISAGIMALIGAAGACNKGLQKLLDLRRASDEIRILLNEVTALQMVLHTAQLALDDMDLGEVQANASIDKVKEGCAALVDQLTADVQELQAFINRCLKRVDGQAKPSEHLVVSNKLWLKMSGKIAKALLRIQESRSSLQSTLIALQLNLGKQHYQAIAQVKDVAIRFHEFAAQAHAEQQSQLEILASKVEQTAYRLDVLNTDAGDRNLLTPGNSNRSIAADSTVVNAIDEKRQTHVCVTTTVWKGGCRISCQCQCHQKSYWKTPEWLRGTLGSMLLTYTGSTILYFTPCNRNLCKERSRKSSFTYYFPSWALSRALVVTSIQGTLSGVGASWSFRMPIVISSTHPIWQAARLDNVEHLRNSFSKGEANVHIVNEYGGSLLHFAASYKHASTYRLLITTYGADDSIEDGTGAPPIASVLGEANFAEFGFNMDDAAEQMGFSPLHLAILFPQYGSLIDALSEHQDQIDKVDRCGMAPIHWACFVASLTNTRQLIKRGANVNLLDRKSRSPLHLACLGGKIDVVYALLEANCSPHHRDFHGETALFNASSQALTDCLLNNGADANHKADHGWTALHTAARFDRSGCAEALVQHGAQVDALDSEGYTPMMRAVAYNSPNACQSLMKHHPDLSLISKSSESILHLAASCANIEIFRLLASANLRDVAESALDCQGKTAGSCFYLGRSKHYIGQGSVIDPVEDDEWHILLSAVKKQSGLVLPQKLEQFGDESEIFMDSLEQQRP